jgi:hypothetical protein
MMMGYKQSLTDLCVFFKKNNNGQMLMFALIHVDDSLLIGTRDEIKRFKEGIKKRFGFTDLGELKKHLGVWYEETFDKNGEQYLEATMPELVDNIIQLYGKNVGKLVKEYDTPGTPGECTEPRSAWAKHWTTKCTKS